MKLPVKNLVLLGAMVAEASVSQAQVAWTWTGSRPIPDNDASGLAFAFSYAPTSEAITDVRVTLNIAGGWNGDLYAYLAHGSGVAVLLNRVGVGEATPGGSPDGYGNAGFDITLSSGGAKNIHDYANQNPVFANGRLTGTWQPDGRETRPDSAPAFFDALGISDFSTFHNLDPNGNWTLFLADLSPLGVSTLNGFSVEVTVVPEPSATVGAAILAIAFLTFRRWCQSASGKPPNRSTGQPFTTAAPAMNAGSSVAGGA